MPHKRHDITVFVTLRDLVTLTISIPLVTSPLSTLLLIN